jgi:hypothetical protein|tara:strand:+ start:378 stop:707 length:330 start_codon:yes stop_codon:yes gene_type:complete
MSQYKIETLYATQGAREYYIEAESADDAATKFNEALIKNDMIKDTLYMMTEDITKVVSNEAERVDIEELKNAEARAWKMKMDKILGSSRDKLRNEMGFGIPNEPPIVKS